MRARWTSEHVRVMTNRSSRLCVAHRRCKVAKGVGHAVTTVGFTACHGQADPWVLALVGAHDSYAVLLCHGIILLQLPKTDALSRLDSDDRELYRAVGVLIHPLRKTLFRTPVRWPRRCRKAWCGRLAGKDRDGWEIFDHQQLPSLMANAFAGMEFLRQHAGAHATGPGRTSSRTPSRLSTRSRTRADQQIHPSPQKNLSSRSSGTRRSLGMALGPSPAQPQSPATKWATESVGGTSRKIESRCTTSKLLTRFCVPKGSPAAPMLAP